MSSLAEFGRAWVEHMRKEERSSRGALGQMTLWPEEPEQKGWDNRERIVPYIGVLYRDPDGGRSRARR